MNSVAIICTNEMVRNHIRESFDAEDSVVYIDLSSVTSTTLLSDERISLIILHIDSFEIDKVQLLEQVISLNKKAVTFVLSDVPDFLEARLLISKGAKGYANSRMLTSGLKHAFSSVLLGDVWMPPAFVLELIKKVKGANQNSSELESKLSKKEMEVAYHVSEGNSNLEIAEKLGISERTIKAHLSTIYEKLNIKDRLTLALMVKSI